VHLEKKPRRGSDRLLVIGDPGAIRGPDLPEDGLALAHHVGDPEAAADLDQLAAGDDHLLSLGEGVQRQEDRGGVVVDHGRGGSGEQTSEQPLRVHRAGTPLATGEIVLQRAVAGRHGMDPAHRLRGERGAPEVRMDEHPGGVDDGNEKRLQVRLEPTAESLAHFPGPSTDSILRGFPRADFGPQPLHHLPEDGRDPLPAVLVGERRDGREPEEEIDLGKLPKKMAGTLRRLQASPLKGCK
jgi:hypothetical protein